MSKKMGRFRSGFARSAINIFVNYFLDNRIAIASRRIVFEKFRKLCGFTGYSVPMPNCENSNPINLTIIPMTRERTAIKIRTFGISRI